MFYRDNKPRRVETVVPVQDREKLLENLGVEPGHPMLGAVLCVIKGNEELAKENLAVADQKDVKPGFYDGALMACMQIQEDLLRIAEEGLAAKAGRKVK